MAEVPDAVLGLSDEDFLKMTEPAAPPSEPATGEPAVDGVATGATVADDASAVVEESAGQAEEDGATVLKDSSQGQAPVAAATDGTVAPETAPGTGAADTTGQPAADASAAAAGAGAVQPATPDYKTFYEKVMAPFKANGKQMELRSPDEAIKLMQAGANYTRKMQELAPHRKLLLMLENNGLLDEGKLSFLIDIEKKNPEAIKKLVKDAGLDPMEIDTSVEPAYRGGNHRVSDEEVAFTAVLDDLKSTQEGTTTLQTINTQWDQASKDVLWKSPELMQTIHQQRENGVYAAITAEMERRKVIGLIPATTQFLAAYKAVGDELHAAGAFETLVQPAQTPAQPVAPVPVATRVQALKPAVVNNAQAAAASPTRSTPQKTEGKPLNVLAMSDEDFLKQSHIRL